MLTTILYQRQRYGHRSRLQYTRHRLRDENKTPMCGALKYDEHTTMDDTPDVQGTITNCRRCF